MPAGIFDDVGPALLLALFLALARVGPLLCAVPFVGIGGRLALFFGAGTLLTPLLLPTVTARMAMSAGGAPASLFGAAPLLVHELFVGGGLLLGVALPWAGMRAAGRLLELAPIGRRSYSRPVERLFGLFALALFFALGGTSIAVRALARSYEVAAIPSSAAWPFAASAAGVIDLFGQLFAVALALALPVLAARLVAELAFSLFLRAGATSTSIGWRTKTAAWAPLTTLLALLTLLVGFSAIYMTWRAHLGTLPYQLEQTLTRRS